MPVNGGYRVCERSFPFLHPQSLYRPVMSDRKDRALLRAQLHRIEPDTSGTQRGQVDPQLIMGAFVLIVIAGPLIAAAVDIQSSLASTPAFSWFTGGVIALLIVAAIVAAALGLE